jgi:hypothetical protein
MEIIEEDSMKICGVCVSSVRGKVWMQFDIIVQF